MGGDGWGGEGVREAKKVKTEYWNGGIMEQWSDALAPTFYYSNIPRELEVRALKL